MCLGIRLPMISSFFLQLSRKFYAIFLFLFPLPTIFISCVPYMPLPLNVARRSLGHGSRIQQLHPPIRLHLLLLCPHPLPPLLQMMCDSRTSWRSFSAWMLPWYTLYRAVSSERLCRPYCSAAGDHGGFASEVSPPPSPVASDSKAEDDDGDDNNASFDDNRDA